MAEPCNASTDAFHDAGRYRRLVEAITDYAIYMLDPNGAVSSWNPGAERFKGYAADEIVGRHFSCFYTEEDRAAGRPAAGLATAEREGRWETEGWRLRKDGSRFWAHVVIDCIRGDHGETLGFAKITRDITERRETERALEQAREALFQAQKMEAVGQLTGGVAHDFNNLLTVILGGLDTLRRSEPHETARRDRALEMATYAAERAASLTARLLAFSRRQPLQPTPTDLNVLARNMEDMLHHIVGETVELEVRLAQRLWAVEVDRNQVENAILNLAVNARDAMPAGGKLMIETANTFLDQSYTAKDAEVRPGRYVVVAVSDTGSGMSKEVLARVFEPFYTTKEVGRGAGLGLSMVYGFVKQSGGHVTIYSEPDQGTTVKLYFPRYVGADVVEPASEALQPAASHGEVVLAVEDSDDVRAFSVASLSELGYRVLEAADAATALTILETDQPIDLLFTDIVLPDMSGRALVERAIAVRPDLKVLFTTGYSHDAVIHQGRLDAGVQLISKPFTFDQLAARVRDTLDLPSPPPPG